jgi:hypothetical protein
MTGEEPLGAVEGAVDGVKYWFIKSSFCFSSKILSLSLSICIFRSASFSLFSCLTISVLAMFNLILSELISALSGVTSGALFFFLGLVVRPWMLKGRADALRFEVNVKIPGFCCDVFADEVAGIQEECL